MKYLILFLLISSFCFGQNISSTEVEKMVYAKLTYDNRTDHNLIATIPVLSDNGIRLAYINELSPHGYIVVAASKKLRPIIAFSYKNNLDEDNKFLHFVKTDLQYRINNLQNIPDSEIAKRNEEWDILISGTKQKGWKFQQWPTAGTTTTGGWVVSNWHQNAPYNNMCPMDPVTSTRSIAGCPSVAMGMILDFHKTTNAVFFDNNDDYYHNYAGRQYNIDDDFSSIQFPPFPQLNLYLDTLQMHYQGGTTLTNNDKAAFVFACGVAATQVYTSSGSGTFGVNQAFQAYQKFNFAGIDLLLESDTDLYTRIRNNIIDTLPVHLAVVDSAWSSGHNVVIDGYNTDEYYHLNFGWGGSSNGWYLLPNEIPYGLTVVEGAIVDIVPNGTVNVVKHKSKFSGIYPNPVKDKIYLQCIGNDDNQYYSVYNLSGSLVETGLIEGNEIDVSALKKGIFILNISSVKGIINKKIVKL